MPLAGIPAISIPSGLSDGLPVGFQLAGPAFCEQRLLDAAYALEQAIGFDGSAARRWLGADSGRRRVRAGDRPRDPRPAEDRTKMFCGCELSFGDQPNSHSCAVCLGLPGALPVVNERAVQFGMMIGLAFGCEIADALAVSPQELLLSRLAEGLPDLPVRRAAVPRRPGRRRAHPPRAPRGGRRQAQPHRRERPHPRRRPQLGRLQPLRDAAGGDRDRTRHPLVRAGARVADAAALDAEGARRVRRQHGGGVAALRRQRVGPAGRLRPSWAPRPSSRT